VVVKHAAFEADGVLVGAVGRIRKRRRDGLHGSAEFGMSMALFQGRM
jgi:hypothetical protein